MALRWSYHQPAPAVTQNTGSPDFIESLVCGYLDYRRKVVGLGPSFYLTGDVKQDMDQIRAFYAPINAKYPEKKGPIRLKEEDLG
jgi:hypothetical protein